jgi:hypothetical protein
MTFMDARTCPKSGTPLAPPSELEILIAAAKAAHISWYGFYGDDSRECHYLDIGEVDVVEWNPLTDGDALRLAVAMGFINPGCWLEELLAPDWCRAQRIAIVHRAALLGGLKF